MLQGLVGGRVQARSGGAANGSRLAVDLRADGAYHAAYEQPVAAGLTILSEAPRDAEQYRLVYGYSPTGATLEAMNAGYARLGPTVRTPGGAGLLRAIATAETGVVVIVGHNEGGRFKTTDGRWETLEQIAVACGQAKKLCVILSCKSREWISAHPTIATVGQDIDFARVVEWLPTISGLTDSAAAYGQIPYPTTLARDIETALAPKFGSFSRLGVPVGGAFVVVALIAGARLCDTDEETCPLLLH